MMIDLLGKHLNRKFNLEEIIKSTIESFFCVKRINDEKNQYSFLSPELFHNLTNIEAPETDEKVNIIFYIVLFQNSDNPQVLPVWLPSKFMLDKEADILYFVLSATLEALNNWYRYDYTKKNNDEKI